MMLATLVFASFALSRQTTCDGITYTDTPSSLWIPVSSLRKGITREMEVDVKKAALLFGEFKAPLRKMVGTTDWAVKLSDLRRIGFSTEWDDDEKKAGLWLNDDVIVVYVGNKLVQVDLDDQELRAYQGQLLVLRTNVSTGFNDRTPRGIFRAIAKERVHYSSLFNRVPMPYSVQVTGNIFIHAFPDVPPYPASHGCIRLPLPAARALFEWVEIDTEIEIH